MKFYLSSLLGTNIPLAVSAATVMDPRKNEDAELAYGAGHIYPLRALSPGLIYDASEADYVTFLCAQGYNTTTLRILTGDSSACSNVSIYESPWNLNYPSFALAVVDGQPIRAVFQRRVTNVGAATSTYRVTIKETFDFTVDVTPSALSFSSVGETKSFTVSLSGTAISQRAIMSGSIEWKDGTHTVRTPIAIYTVLSREAPLSEEF